MSLWRITCLFLALLGLAACLVRTPGINGQQYAQPVVMHSAFIGTNPCESCHEIDRPAALEGAPHGGGNDCIMCHTPSDTNAGWLPVNPFTHVAALTTCLECHAADRPPPPHMQYLDCVLCHIYRPGNFQPTLPGATDTAPPPTTSSSGGTSTGTSSGTSAALQGVDGG